MDVVVGLLCAHGVRDGARAKCSESIGEVEGSCWESLGLPVAPAHKSCHLLPLPQSPMKTLSHSVF